MESNDVFSGMTGNEMYEIYSEIYSEINSEINSGDIMEFEVFEQKIAESGAARFFRDLNLSIKKVDGGFCKVYDQNFYGENRGIFKEFEKKVKQKGVENFLLDLGVSKDLIETSKKTSPEVINNQVLVDKEYRILGNEEKREKYTDYIETDAKLIKSIVRGSVRSSEFNYSFFELLEKTILEKDKFAGDKTTNLDGNRFLYLLYSLEKNGLEKFAKSFLSEDMCRELKYGCIVNKSGDKPTSLFVSSDGNHRSIIANILGLKILVWLKSVTFYEKNDEIEKICFFKKIKKRVSFKWKITK